MDRQRSKQTLHFIRNIANETGMKKIKINFHGGEPLAAGHDFFHYFFDILTSEWPQKKIEYTIQSNLWLLDEAYCQMFNEYNVSIGTSLDGPENINDSQRGKGYFKKTMAGIEKARSRGLDVGCITTFTQNSRFFFKEITDFFISEKLSFCVHAALPSIQNPNFQYTLTPEEMIHLNSNLLEYYLENRKKIVISTYDQMAKSMLEGQGNICTFKDCLGMFLAVDPYGNIYPCQRFCGNENFRMGSLDESPSAKSIFDTPIALRMKAREKQISRECENCEHLTYCRGGCFYNACTKDNDSVKDSYCQAYKQTFAYIQNRLIQEMGKEENIAEVVKHPPISSRNILLKKGPLIDIVRSGPHPSTIAMDCKRIIAAVELARGPNMTNVAERLTNWGICRTQNTAIASLEHLERSIKPEKNRLNNLYLHATFACQLHCTHCYARAEKNTINEISPIALKELINQAKQAGFRQVVITGGEPLIHSKRHEMLVVLQNIKSTISPMNLVLRTNFALHLKENELKKIAKAFHRVVVSIDGDRKFHNQRRGKGTYEASVANIEIYQSLANTLRDAAELSITAVLQSNEIEGKQGDAVRKLSERLGILRTRFRPLLPLGRAADWKEPPQSVVLGAYPDPLEIIENGFYPIASCGIGQNLYVEPSGDSFPCYAYRPDRAFLGNVLKKGLIEIIDSKAFQELSLHTVDTKQVCQHCEYRYLCGGACHAWNSVGTKQNLDTAPLDCTTLQQRAFSLYNMACEYLEIEDKI